MALATQCPHCHTIFKVAHDQLKLRSGLVRCGACKQIFNGIENLVAPDQANAGTALPAAEKPGAVPAAPTPGSASVPSFASASVPAPTPPAAAPATRQAAAPIPPAVPPTSPKDLKQAAPSTPPDIEPSAIDALEFIHVDDPETRTRILDAGEEPHQAPAQTLADDLLHLDEDPLTRMTLVDFSVFDENIASEAMQEPAEQAPDLPLESEETWPDSRTQANEAAITDEAAMPAPPEARDMPAMPDEPGLPEFEPAPHAATQFSWPSRHEAAASEASPAPRDVVKSDARQPSPDEPDTLAAAPTESETAPDTIADFTTDSATFHEQDHDEEDAGIASPLAEDEADEPDFVKNERRRQRRRKILNIVMTIGSVLLLAGLLLQAAYVFRNDLAVRFPQTRPLLSQLCDITGCQILLPAQIEQVSIESNELQMQPANKNAFTLSLLLHNRSEVPQAWPYIELTLNDQDGKALVRRVLTPKEYLPTNKGLAEGIPARSEQAVKVNFELNQLQASDYRVYLFYP